MPASKRIFHVGALLTCTSLGLVAQSAALRIAVVSGEGAVYTAGSRAAKPLVVEVTDGTGRPVEGARVSFQTPNEGPGGVFSSKLHTDLTVTDASGRATVRALDLNRTPGPFSIRITAAKDLARAGVIAKQYIAETNAAAVSSKAPETGVTKLAASIPAAGKNETEPAKLTTDSTKAASPPPAPVQAATTAVAPKKPAIAATESGLQARSRSSSVPTVVITKGAPRQAIDPGASAVRKSHKKWIWIAVLAAAGAAGAVAGPGLVAGTGAHGSTAAPGILPTVSIGPPTISIGKP